LRGGDFDCADDGVGVRVEDEEQARVEAPAPERRVDVVLAVAVGDEPGLDLDEASVGGPDVPGLLRRRGELAAVDEVGEVLREVAGGRVARPDDSASEELGEDVGVEQQEVPGAEPAQVDVVRHGTSYPGRQMRCGLPRWAAWSVAS
jgi:hypothetical protein